MDVAGAIWRAGRAVFNRTPELKHAVKNVLLGFIASPAAQRRAYRRWRARTYPAVAPGTVTAGPLIEIHTDGPPSEALRASLRAQSYGRWTTEPALDAELVAWPRTASDTLWPNALERFVRAFADDPAVDLAYADEETRTHDLPLLKPDYNPELADAADYLGLLVARRALAEATESSARHERALALAGRAATIRHIPEILSSSDLAGSAAPVRPALQGRPKVSIVIPSKNALDVVRRCIDSIYARSTYDDFEVVLVDTGSDDPAVRAYYAEVAARHPSFRVVEFPEQPFSYARSCNAGADAATGEILVMLNNDTEVLTPDWIERLAAEAQRPDVGAVGPLLLFPDGTTIQHAGIALGVGYIAANVFSGLPADGALTPSQALMVRNRRECLAVTGACLVVRTESYRAVGGFDPLLRITFNDVDLCLRLRERGWRSLYTPDVRLLHHESVSVAKLVRGQRDWDEVHAAAALMRERWQHLIDADPLINPHVGRNDTRYRHRG